VTLQVGQIVRFNARGDPSHSFVARDPADAADAPTTAIDWLFGFIVPAVTLLLLVLIFAVTIGGVA
jgi:hypothetical protein